MIFLWIIQFNFRNELSSHDSEEDCWIAYKGKVYDITDYIPEHPGRADTITPYCGTSSEFEKAFISRTWNK